MKTAEISVRFNAIELKGSLSIPKEPNSLVIFSHGSGSSRFSSRNRRVAEVLQEYNMATLLTDLLTQKEDSVYQNRFNIKLLTERLVAVTNEVTQLSDLKNLNVGFFGANTGAASALRAASRLRDLIGAVVSRGGRPDLAGDDLPLVKAPTLLLVGSLDTDVVKLNEQAYAQIRSEKKLKIVHGAGHLFEEPGKLDEVAQSAASWFKKYLVVNPISQSS
jgi:putative phosphoribosyl transferase